MSETISNLEKIIVETGGFKKISKMHFRSRDKRKGQWQYKFIKDYILELRNREKGKNTSFENNQSVYTLQYFDKNQAVRGVGNKKQRFDSSKSKRMSKMIKEAKRKPVNEIRNNFWIR